MAANRWCLKPVRLPNSATHAWSPAGVSIPVLALTKRACWPLITSRAFRRCRRSAAPRCFRNARAAGHLIPTFPAEAGVSASLRPSLRDHLPALVELGAPAMNRTSLTALRGQCIVTMLQGQSGLGAGSVNRTPVIRCTKATVCHWPKPARRTVFRPCETTNGNLAAHTRPGLAVGTRVRGDDQRLSFRSTMA